MYFSEIVFVLAVYLLTSIRANFIGNFVEDYCWRDYDGIIPFDALEVGTDRKSKPIYVGQTLFQDKLIPGKIHENVNEIHIEFYEAFIINETIKILCTQSPEKFDWFKTKYDEVINIKDKHLFEGGYEKGVITYIGRAMSHGEMTVGKVICWPTNCIRLTTIENGTWTAHDEFEVLTYDPYSKNQATYHSHKPSFLSYFLLVLATAVLIVIVVLVVRRCKT